MCGLGGAWQVLNHSLCRWLPDVLQPHDPSAGVALLLLLGYAGHPGISGSPFSPISPSNHSLSVICPLPSPLVERMYSFLSQEHTDSLSISFSLPLPPSLLSSFLASRKLFPYLRWEWILGLCLQVNPLNSPKGSWENRTESLRSFVLSACHILLHRQCGGSWLFAWKVGVEKGEMPW